MVTQYPINRGKDDNLSVNTTIQHKLTELQEYVCNKHNKVLAVRFDVHYPEHCASSGGNKEISRMVSKLVQHYERRGFDPHYVWTREQNASYNPHYHCVLFLNGNKTRHCNQVFSTAEKYWESTLGAEVKGCINHCTQHKENKHENGILLVRSAPDFKEKFDQVHYQISYLAKSRDKADPKDGLRDIGMSRVKN